MKLFTVKDYLIYNNPCFSCANNINFGAVSKSNDKNKMSSMLIPPMITPHEISFDLKISYLHSLKLIINAKTNEFYVNEISLLKNYLINNILFLKSNCLSCKTVICSSNLSFDFNSNRVKPVYSSHEYLTTSNNGIKYSLYTDDQDSIITISGINNDIFQLATPPLYLYNFKNKEKFISKLQTYLTFS